MHIMFDSGICNFDFESTQEWWAATLKVITEMSDFSCIFCGDVLSSYLTFQV